MSPLYNVSITVEGYHFVSGEGHKYLLYFFESSLPDAENNNHIVYNVGLMRNGKHDCMPFTYNFDSRIRETIMHTVNEFFKKNDYAVLVYFCFGDDGYARHRNIIFNKWFKDLDLSTDKYNTAINYDGGLIYGSLIIARDNPLKKLIIDSFERYVRELDKLS